LTFLLSLEIRRDAVFSFNTPLLTPRRISGSAAANAVRAPSASPLETACSTFLIKVRTRLVLDRLIAVRLAVCRIRFLAERWCAMIDPLS
jgi:hypothetical protein